MNIDHCFELDLNCNIDLDLDYGIYRNFNNDLNDILTLPSGVLANLASKININFDLIFNFQGNQNINLD